MNLKIESEPENPAEKKENPADLDTAGQPHVREPVYEDLESHSSMLEKVDPVTRAKIRRALVDRDPPTYRGVFQKFKPVLNGVSFTAFYYYARRIRMTAAVSDHARRNLPEGVQLNDLLPDLLARRLLEEVDNPGAAPRRIQRLVDAYRMVSQIHLARRRADVLLARKSRELAEAEKKARMTPEERLADMSRLIQQVYGLSPQLTQFPPAAEKPPD
ncbi:MAG TPA: hypothetical protein VNT79_15705 [Phycisphaerae bacterium]|nr:hypothetical protein [Phycisphaerae bacterium]